METILILHGWGSSSKRWTRVKKILESKGCQVFVPDLPGFGENPPPTQAWSVNNYVEWVKSFSEKQNLSQFFLLGHSFGGRIAIKFAAKYPEELKGLILCSSAGIKPRKGLKISIIEAIAKFGKVVFHFPGLTRFYPFFQEIFYRRILRKNDYLATSGIMKEVFKKIIDEDLTPYLAEIKVPTLLIWGENDKITPKKDAYMIKERIPGAVLKIIPKAGHRINFEAPEDLSKAIIQFLR